MIILSSTTDTIQVYLSGPITTNQLDIVASYRDIGTASYVPGRKVSVSNNTTNVTIVDAPAASTQRVVDFINIHNTDNGQATVTVVFDDNGSPFILYSGIIEPTQTITYQEGAGWLKSDMIKSMKAFTVHGDAGANFTLTNSPLAERLAGNSARSVFSVDLEGYTQVRVRVNRQVAGAAAGVFRAKYSTSYSTVLGSYLQLGASGQVDIPLNGTGYYDTGWVDMAVGARISPCFIGFTELGGDGALDPALGAVDILFR